MSFLWVRNFYWRPLLSEMWKPDRSEGGGASRPGNAQSSHSLYYGRPPHPGRVIPSVANSTRRISRISGISFYSFSSQRLRPTKSGSPNHSTVHDCRGRSVFFLGVSRKKITAELGSCSYPSKPVMTPRSSSRIIS